MTVETQSNKTAAQVMGASTYAFTFRTLLEDPTSEEAKQAIKVSISDGTTETELTYGTDYSVALDSSGYGGTVTVADAKSSSYSLIIYREYDMRQGSRYRDYDEFPASTLENGMDKLTMFTQQLQEQLDRAVKVDITSDVSPDVLKGQVTRIYASIDNVDTVADNISSVNTAAANTSNINTVAGISSSVSAVAAVASDVPTVANDLTNVDKVANKISNVNTVAGSIASVNTTADNISSVNAVATDLADEDSNIKAVVNNETNINIVAGISEDVSTVAGISGNVTAVKNNATNINTVAGSISNVNATGSNIASVNTVADNISSVNTAAANISDIQAAPTAATNAANSATQAQNWAKGNAEVCPDGSAKYWAISMSLTNRPEGSAKYWATQAASSASNASTSESNALSYKNAAAASEENAAASATAAENNAIIAETAAENILGNDNVKAVAENIRNINTVANHADDIGKVATNEALGTIRIVAETINDYNADLVGGVAYTADFGETICGGLNDTEEFEETICGGVVDTVFDNVFETDMKTICDNIDDLKNVSENAEEIIADAALVEEDTALVVANTEEFSKRFDSQEFQDVANAAGNINRLAGTLGWVETIIHYLQYLGKIIHGGVATTSEWGDTICGGLADTTEYDETVHGGLADTCF